MIVFSLYGLCTVMWDNGVPRTVLEQSWSHHDNLNKGQVYLSRPDLSNLLLLARACSSSSPPLNNAIILWIHQGTNTMTKQ